MFCLPGITLCLLFFIYQKKNNWKLGIVSTLFLAYIGMFFLAIIGYILAISRPVLPISGYAMIYLSVAFIVVFFGYFEFEDKNFNTIVIENSWVYAFLEYSLILCGVLSFIFFTPFAIIALQGNIDHNRIVHINFSALESFGLINSVTTLFANLFIYMLLFAFIDFSKNKKWAIIRGFILLVCSQSFIVYILAYVGRDGSVYWFMSLIFIFFLMKDFITVSLKKKIILVSVILTIIAFIPFMMITLSRFSDGSKSNILNEEIIQDMKYFFIAESIINYSGQQISNFNDIFVINPPKRMGGLNFPVIANFIEAMGLKINAIYDNKEMYSYYFEHDASPWVFSTFIGSFIADFGRLGTIILLFLISLGTAASTSKCRNTGRFYLSDLIIFILLYQIVYWGVFYFRHYSINYYMLSIFLLFIFIRITHSHKHQIQIEKL